MSGDKKSPASHAAAAAAEMSLSSKEESTEESSRESWHSDSEANWTLPGGSIRHYRDLGLSQTLSEFPYEAGGRDSGGDRGEGIYPRKTSVTFNEPPSSFGKTRSKDRLLPVTIREMSTTSLQEDDSERTRPSQPSAEAPHPIQHSGTVPSNDQAAVLSSTEVAKHYGFELPRSLEVFGHCSWNLLPLAVRTNLVKPLREPSE